MNNVWRKLYPNGRAFLTSEETNRTKVHRSIDVICNEFLEQLKTLVAGTLAFNSIDETEIEFLENRYGIYFIEGLTLQERINRIRERMAYPNGIVNRSSAAWIEYVLRSFGFDVSVYENDGISPEVLGGFKITQYGSSRYGSSSYGGYKYDVIANSMFENESYSFGGNLWATFFIRIGTEIDSSRVREFRELVLKLKPAHLVAIIFRGEGIGDFNEDFNNDFFIGFENE